MAEDDSSTSDPAVTEWPSAAAGLIILVGPDPPGEPKTGSAPPGGPKTGSAPPGGPKTGSGPPGGRARPARQLQELREDPDGPGVYGQGPGVHGQGPGVHGQGPRARGQENN